MSTKSEDNGQNAGESGKQLGSYITDMEADMKDIDCTYDAEAAAESGKAVG